MKSLFYILDLSRDKENTPWYQLCAKESHFVMSCSCNPSKFMDTVAKYTKIAHGSLKELNKYISENLEDRGSVTPLTFEERKQRFIDSDGGIMKDELEEVTMNVLDEIEVPVKKKKSAVLKLSKKRNTKSEPDTPKEELKPSKEVKTLIKSKPVAKKKKETPVEEKKAEKHIASKLLKFKPKKRLNK